MPGKILLKRIFFLILAVVAVILSVNSCRGLKDEDQYVGNWQYSDTISADDIIYITTRTLQLTKTTYEESYVIERQSPGTISAIIGTKGRLSRSRNFFIFELKELGTCARDTIDACTTSLMWYGEGTQYWTQNVGFFGLVIKGDLKADETTLTLIRDLNNDGDTLDAGEYVVFTRL